MGSVEYEVQLLWRSLRDESGEPPKVSAGGPEGRKGGVGGYYSEGGRGDGGRDSDRSGDKDGYDRDKGDGDNRDRSTGSVSLAEGSDTSTCGLPGGADGGGGNVACGGNDNQGG